MDDATRNDLLNRLADARRREAEAKQELQALTSGERRDSPGSKPQNGAGERYMHAFSVWQRWKEASLEIAAILKQLNDSEN